MTNLNKCALGEICETAENATSRRKKSPLLKFLRAMELTGFLPINWIEMESDEDGSKTTGVRVTLAKTLFVLVIDFAVVLGQQ
jgi:hypothetical protein